MNPAAASTGRVAIGLAVLLVACGSRTTLDGPFPAASTPDASIPDAAPVDASADAPHDARRDAALDAGECPTRPAPLGIDPAAGGDAALSALAAACVSGTACKAGGACAYRIQGQGSARPPTAFCWVQCACDSGALACRTECTKDGPRPECPTSPYVPITQGAVCEPGAMGSLESDGCVRHCQCSDAGEMLCEQSCAGPCGDPCPTGTCVHELCGSSQWDTCVQGGFGCTDEGQCYYAFGNHQVAACR